LADLDGEEQEQEQEQEQSQRAQARPSILSRRRSIGEIFGLTSRAAPPAPHEQQEQQQEAAQGDVSHYFTDDDSDGEADISASGSSLGDESVRRYFLSSDASACTSISTCTSLSPLGQDVVVHDTFHSPSFTSKPRSRAVLTPSSCSPSPAQQKCLLDELDKENLRNVTHSPPCSVGKERRVSKSEKNKTKSKSKNQAVRAGLGNRDQISV
jgi:hypothetical protein